MSAKSDLQLEQEQELKEEDEVCASCGIAAVDNVKLKSCDGGYDLVKYCNDGCQQNHREHHNEECKQRVDEIHDDIQRQADDELRETFLSDELHDKKLFTQTDSSCIGECPICCLPLSLEPSKSIFMSCCCKKSVMDVILPIRYVRLKRTYTRHG